MELLRPLLEATESGRSLAEVVQQTLQHTWETGGGHACTGPQPERIHIRRKFLFRPGLPIDEDDEAKDLEADEHRAAEAGESVLQRLIKSKGLQLRLQLLLLFDAQCRHEPGGSRVRNTRTVNPRNDQDFAAWRQLTLSPSQPTPRTGRGAAALRGRQITEALKALQRHHLVVIPTDPAGRRHYDEFTMLTETGLPDELAYTVPYPGATTFSVPRTFFTNLWVFALTDAEIATYLVLSFLRARFPTRHEETGVYVHMDAREDVFGLTRYAYGSHEMLHRFRLIERQLDPDRSYATGRVGDFKKKYAKGKGNIRPHTFKLDDNALERPALPAIQQILEKPTLSDIRRPLMHRDEILGLDNPEGLLGVAVAPPSNQHS
jgi:hypothetical protein